DRHVADAISRALGPVDAQRHPHAARPAARDRLEELLQVEFLSAVEDALRLAVGGVAVDQVARAGPRHRLAVIEHQELGPGGATAPLVHAAAESVGRDRAVNAAGGGHEAVGPAKADD